MPANHIRPPGIIQSEKLKIATLYVCYGRKMSKTLEQYKTLVAVKASPKSKLSSSASVLGSTGSGDTCALQTISRRSLPFSIGRGSSKHKLLLVQVQRHKRMVISFVTYQKPFRVSAEPTLSFAGCLRHISSKSQQRIS